MLKKNNIEDIVILGRGRSRLFYFDGEKNEISNVMLVNYESQDLSKKSLTYLSQKKIHIIFNICEPHLKKEEIDRLKISSIHVAIPWTMRILGTRKRLNKRGNIYGNVKYLSYKMHNRWWLGNSGLIAIAHSVEVLKIKNIHLYGFEFYSDPKWANESYQNNEEYRRENQYSKTLINNFYNYIEQNPDTNFYIKAHTDFKPIKNLIVET